MRFRGPLLEQPSRPAELLRVKRKRIGVRDLRDRRPRSEAFGGVERVTDRKAVRDDQDRRLGPFQQRPEGSRIAPDRVGPALVSARDDVVGPVRPSPDAVVREETPLVLAETDVVEGGEDDPRDVSTLERDVRGLLGAEEFGDDAEVEVLHGKPFPQRPRLLAARLCQRDLPPRVAVRQSLDRGPALGVAREEGAFHGLILPAAGDHPLGGWAALPDVRE